MSGKRQHFIPQFLQKGFSSHTDKEKYYTWVFRKDSTPFNTNIKNIGIENEFYSLDGNSEVDEKITELENSLGQLVFELRNKPYGQLNSSQIPKLIAHLEVRTRHLRQNFLKMNEVLIQEIKDFLKDGTSFVNYAKNSISNKNSPFYKTLIEELQRIGIKKNAAEKLVDTSPELFIGLLEKSSDSSFSKIRKGFNDIDLERAIKKAHIDVLGKTISPKIRRKFYDKFKYHLIEIKNKSLIQGDPAILFKIENGFKTFVDKSDNIKAVLLPISPSKLLIGKKESFNLNTEKLPQILSKFSLEYFISSEKNNSLKNLQTVIGNKAKILSDETIKRLVKDFFNA